MAKVTEPTEVANDASKVNTFSISLDEFCQRLSAKKTSPELISGFHHTQKVAGIAQDSDAAYTARLAAFIKQPA